MEEKSDFGREIIKDMTLDIDEKAADALVSWLEEDRSEDAHQLGAEYNDKDGGNMVSKSVMDTQFGNGYICALKHMQEILDNLK